MRPIARGAHTRSMLLLALLLAACRGRDAGSGAGDAASSAAAARPVGDPRAPLPAPLAAPEGERESVAWMLAERVRAGGDDAVPALLTALRLSGIAVRGADGALAADGDRPYQGFVIEAWEVRPLAALARENRLTLVTLSDMADVVRAAVPALKDAPVERMILDGLRAHAYDERSGLDFWTQFVVALGRQLPNAREPDLLAASDPKAVVLDGLQASLVMRRLATDLLVLTEGRAPKRSARAAPRPAPVLADRPLPAPLRWFAPTPLHAAVMAGARECTMSDATQKIMDLTALGTGALIGGATVGGVGFPGLVGYLKSHLPDAAVEKLESVDLKMKGLSVLLAYGQFMMTYGALDATIDLDAPPLVRTKDHTPGERKNLVATLRMSIGDKQMVNCFRIMLNSVGLDFSLPNDGPAKGAKVAWAGIEGFDQAAAALHGGPEAIVQFADDPANRIQDGAAWRFTSANAVINQTADSNGVVRIAVEGRGQPERVPASARPVRKYATVGIDVALKGADLFGDMKDAAGTALAGGAGLLTMPLELLYRSKWYTAATLTFPVQDWGEGGGWSGNVRVAVRTHSDYTERMVPMRQRETRFTLVNFDFTSGVGSWIARESRTLEQSASECVLAPRTTRSALSGSGPAWLRVADEEPSEERIPESGGEKSAGMVDFAYARERTAVGVSGLELEGIESGTALECEFTEQGVRRVQRPFTGDVRAPYFPLGSAYGAIPDPSEQLSLRGTLSSPYDDPDTHERGTVTVSWNLWRTDR